MTLESEYIKWCNKLIDSINTVKSDLYYCTRCDEGFKSIIPTDEGQYCESCLPSSATPHNEIDATTQREDFEGEE